MHASPLTDSGPPNHYGVLDLPDPMLHGSLKLSDSAIKRAYHAALLRHHPDKASSDLTALKICQRAGASSRISVDAITEAYRTLSNPQLRAAYDRELRLSPSRPGASLTPGQRAAHHVVGATEGLPVMDLDDLHYDEGTGVWWHTCTRCGSPRGVEVTADDLEDAAGNDKDAADGEVLVGCSGCSLWTRITFQVALTEDTEAVKQPSSQDQEESHP